MLDIEGFTAATCALDVWIIEDKTFLEFVWAENFNF